MTSGFAHICAQRNAAWVHKASIDVSVDVVIHA
jgi:hypothetical protein